MTIKAIPQKYRTSDGREWSTMDEAERHQMLVDARKVYDEARLQFGQALARTQTTADGRPFEFGWHKYVYVTEGWMGLPKLETVEFYGYDFDFRERDDAFVIYIRKEDRTREYVVSDLYRDHRLAERALLAAQEKWLAERAEEVAELRAKLHPTIEEEP